MTLIKNVLGIVVLIIWGTASTCKSIDETTSNSDISKAIAQLRVVNEDEQVTNDLHTSTKLELLKAVHRARLKKFALELIVILQDDLKSDESAEILGLLPLPEELKKKLLSSGSTPDKVKARLGDPKAEARVIDKFINTHGVEKKQRALMLLYMDTPKAWHEFFKGLESREVFTDVHGNKYSQAGLLLSAYAKVYPEEILFSYAEFGKHDASPDEFKGKEHQDYLRKVESFFHEKHKVNVTIDPPLLYDAHIVPVYLTPNK